jgi:adenosine deaminase
VHEARDLGVIGIGIGGSEHKFPPEAFAPVYRQARELGFKTSAHAGEAAGPKSMWGAIRTLEVDRIGHGTRAVEDPQLIEYLAAKKIPLELCVLSPTFARPWSPKSYAIRLAFTTSAASP